MTMENAQKAAYFLTLLNQEKLDLDEIYSALKVVANGGDISIFIYNAKGGTELEELTFDNELSIKALQAIRDERQLRIDKLINEIASL